MIIIPAIDIKEGRCVRLTKGEEGTETVFSRNPVEVASKWEKCGAKWIHVVDLDGAFQGCPVNIEIVKDIADTVTCGIQVGGGIRNMKSVESYFQAGVNRIILGTSAFGDSEFLSQVCREFPGRVAVGVDTKNGKIAVKGWKEVLDKPVEEVLTELHQLGVSLIIHTNVDRDGTLEGVNTSILNQFMDYCEMPVVVSGGIASDTDLEKISRLPSEKLYGVILGKSIYTGKIDLREAISRYS